MRANRAPLSITYVVQCFCLFIYVFCFSIYRRTFVVRIGINFSMMIVVFFLICAILQFVPLFHDFFFPFCKIMFNHSSSASSIIVVVCRIGTPWTVKNGGIFCYQLLPRRLRNLVSNWLLLYLYYLDVRGNRKFEAKLHHLSENDWIWKFKLTICSMFNSPSGDKNSIVFGEGGRENFYTCHKMYLCCIIALTVCYVW